MAGKPGPLQKLKSRFVKRGYHGCDEANTVAARSLRFTCQTGVVSATEWVDPPDADQVDEDDRDVQPTGDEMFPALIETQHAPLLDVVFANIYLREGTQPPAAHLLYVCTDEREGEQAELVLRTRFRDEAPTGSDEEFQVVRQTYRFPFDVEKKTPDEQLYLAFLFIHGESARADEVTFEGIEVIDVSDDSPHGFADGLALWLADNETAKCKLALVETSAEIEIVDDLEDELEAEDLQIDPADQPAEVDDWPWKVQDGDGWLVE